MWRLFHGEYGLSIILVTIIVRIVVLPLFVNQFKKQRVFQEKMAVIKPQVDSIQAKMKQTKDAEKQKELQMEMMKLYREHNLNPMAMGCLPMLVQFPILIGFYYAIRSTPEIASHSFLWFSLGHSDILVSLCAKYVFLTGLYFPKIKREIFTGCSKSGRNAVSKNHGLYFPCHDDRFFT